jgi:hypothetical protein
VGRQGAAGRGSEAGRGRERQCVLVCVTCHDGTRALWLQVLRQYSINLSEEEFFHVLEYYDKALSSKISYNDFLRAFLQ